jgi:hypothetical protein
VTDDKVGIEGIYIILLNAAEVPATSVLEETPSK